MDVFYRALTSVLFGLMSALGIQPAPTTWQMQPLDGRSVSLTISDHPNSSHSAIIRIDEFDGLDALSSDHNTSSAQPVRFLLKRDADIRDLATLGYRLLALADLVRLYDHAVETLQQLRRKTGTL